MELATALEFHEPAWEQLIPPEQWKIYSSVMRTAQKHHIPFALGGGTAFSHYSGRWRDSKDLDLYVLPADHEAMIDLVNGTGLTDYFDVLPYDRGWIYRSHNGQGIIVDVMWQMANYRAVVDERWLTAGEAIHVHGMDLRCLPAEELIWSKLYIFQRDRCDYTDLINIFFARGEHLDWSHLLGRLGDDRPLLAGVLGIFAWVCPCRAYNFPVDLWAEVGARRPAPGGLPVDPNRVRLIDSRDWFGPTPSTFSSAK